MRKDVRKTAQNRKSTTTTTTVTKITMPWHWILIVCKMKYTTRRYQWTIIIMHVYENDKYTKLVKDLWKIGGFVSPFLLCFAQCTRATFNEINHFRCCCRDVGVWLVIFRNDVNIQFFLSHIVLCMKDTSLFTPNTWNNNIFNWSTYMQINYNLSDWISETTK